MKCHFVSLRGFWNSEQKRLRLNYVSEACSIRKVPQVNNWSCDIDIKLPPMEFPIIPCNFLPLHPILHSGIIFVILSNSSFPPFLQWLLIDFFPETARKWDFWVMSWVPRAIQRWLEFENFSRSHHMMMGELLLWPMLLRANVNLLLCYGQKFWNHQERIFLCKSLNFCSEIVVKFCCVDKKSGWRAVRSQCLKSSKCGLELNSRFRLASTTCEFCRLFFQSYFSRMAVGSSQ